jgi:hypothetical protein
VKKKTAPAPAPVLKPQREPRELKVSDGTQSRIKALQNRAADLLAEIGRLEVKKSGYLSEIALLNSEGAAILAKEAKALGIPENTAWKVSPNGSVEISE